MQSSLQWVPSHGAISGNERANALAAITHSQDPSINVDRFVQEHRIVTDSARRSHPGDRIAQCYPLSPAPRRQISRAAVSLLHLLPADNAFKNKTWHRIGRAESLTCVACGEAEDGGTLYLHVPVIRMSDNFSPAHFAVLACLLPRWIACCFRLHPRGELGLCLERYFLFPRAPDLMNVCSAPGV